MPMNLWDTFRPPDNRDTVDPMRRFVRPAPRRRADWYVRPDETGHVLLPQLPTEQSMPANDNGW